MIQSTRTFRVFVSSTFSDLKAERNALQEKVFPRLRELCANHGCRFQAIDLRWGVSEEAALDQQAMRICLEEVARCQLLSPRPNFIILLGDRYGWQPVPYEIAASEYERIIQNVDSCEEIILNEWYRRDDNAVPPVYDLLPREGVYEDLNSWAPIEKELLRILKKGIENLNLPESSRLKYWSSATEQEIYKGALNAPDAREHVFCFLRSIKGITEGKTARDFIDLDENSQRNEEAFARLSALKERLRERLPGNTFDYVVDWNGRIASKDHIKLLCEDVLRALTSIISKEMATLEKSDPLDREIFDQEAFRKQKAEHFVGRTEMCRRILEYTNTDPESPLCIYGLGGSGKSALLSSIIPMIKNAHRRAAILFRFIGATPPSVDVRSLLEGLCRQLSRFYNQDEVTVPYEYVELVEDFQQRLAHATPEKPLILVLDALDQLSDADSAKSLGWLPRSLPKNVHIIVTAIKPSECLTVLMKKLPASHLMELPELTKQEGKSILDIWLRDAGRTLTSFQRHAVLSALARCSLPLYLKLAFEEARRWKSYDGLSALKTEIRGIIGDLIDRLCMEINHGPVIVPHSLGYLAASKNGLTEDELIDVLSANHDCLLDFRNRARKSPKSRRLPVIVWSRLHFDLRPYLTERSADNTNLISFFHREFHVCVVESFLTDKLKQKRHQQLAQYFKKQSLIFEQKGSRLVNLRKLSELLFHQIEGGIWPDAVKTLCDFQFVNEKCEAGMTYEYFDELTRCYETLKKRKTEDAKRLLKSAIKLIAYGTEHQTGTNLHFTHAFFAYKTQDQYRKFYQDLLEAGQKKGVLRYATSSEVLRDKLRIEFVAKNANIMRRGGTDLRRTEKKITEYINEWHRFNEIYSDLDTKDLARGEYELAYIYYLQGEFTKSVDLFEKSVSHSAEANDTVGMWISKCLEFRVRYLGELNPVDDFKSVLLDAIKAFRVFTFGKDKNPHAVRWVMNVNAHLFEVAFEKDDTVAAVRQIELLDPDFWIAHFAEPHFMIPYYARLAFLKHDYGKANDLFENYFTALNIKNASENSTESLSRDYLDWGRTLLLAGQKERALEIWKAGLKGRDDLANHAWKKRILAQLRNLNVTP